MKQCRVCKVELEEGRKPTICKACDSAKQREYYKNNRDKCLARSKNRARSYNKIHPNVVFINGYKQECGCYHCGEDDVRCLQLHHLDPKTKKFHVNSTFIRNKTVDILIQELDKCIVLCANCHFIEHDRLRNCLNK